MTLEALINKKSAKKIHIRLTRTPFLHLQHCYMCYVQLACTPCIKLLHTWCKGNARPVQSRYKTLQ